MPSNDASRHSPLIWLVFLVIVIDLVGFGLVIPLLPFMAPSLGGDAADIAFIMITYAIGAAIIAPMWGRLSDTAGRRFALVLALLASSGAYVVTALSDTLMQVYVGRALSGLAAGSLPVATALMAEVGVGDLDYLQTQDRHSATVGALGASVSSRAHRDDEQSSDSYFVLSSKALADKMDGQLALMSDTLSSARFDELSRIRDLVSQIRARRDQGITGSGHALAMSAACAGMSPLARLGHEQGGLEGIRRIRALDDALADDGELETLAASLSALHQKLSQSGTPFLCPIADEPNLTAAAEAAVGRVRASAALELEALCTRGVAMREQLAALSAAHAEVSTKLQQVAVTWPPCAVQAK